MSNNKTLSSFVIAKLYKDSLVLIDDKNEKITEEIEKDVNILYLGENKKNILILLYEENALHITDESFQFLTSILSACKLNIADVAIINIKNQTIHINLINQQLNPKICIAFGNIISDILPNNEINLNTPTTINNTIWLNTLEFSILQDNSVNAKVEKSKLWVSLKQIFQI